MELASQRASIQNTVNQFANNPNNRLMIFPPSDPIEMHMIHCAVDDAKCVGVNYGSNRDEDKCVILIIIIIIFVVVLLLRLLL